ncbi:uncharacterized protein LOC106132957 [Amyelois transitella]|uniref:uncharacterized protein LOC106132957 n=1 Tax=Amyelois transitella TaxID=680683 RepID=UPI00067D4387|nr:uncharacterized protein LOC106132957 [Amyelois transitella]
MNRCNPNLVEYATYLQSIIRLDALEKMTQDLDKELADSQKLMRDIKAIFESVPKGTNATEEPVNNSLRHEDISKFLEADVPKLLLPDMVESTSDIDIDDVISKMKGYAEDLKKNLIVTVPHVRDSHEKMEALDLEQYAMSLDQLNKRLANIKMNKGDIASRNPELENKLGQLCQDVDMFTKMVEAKTALSECNKNWTKTSQDNNALQYDSIVNKLLSGINEVSYLLQNRS